MNNHNKWTTSRNSIEEQKSICVKCESNRRRGKVEFGRAAVRLFAAAAIESTMAENVNNRPSQGYHQLNITSEWDDYNRGVMQMYEYFECRIDCRIETVVHIHNPYSDAGVLYAMSTGKLEIRTQQWKKTAQIIFIFDCWAIIIALLSIKIINKWLAIISFSLLCVSSLFSFPVGISLFMIWWLIVSCIIPNTHYSIVSSSFTIRSIAWLIKC